MKTQKLSKKKFEECMKREQLDKSFPICSVCREDVVYALMEMTHFKPHQLSRAEAEKKALAMDDGDMETLARKMSDAFSNTDTYSDALNCWLEELEANE